MTYILIRNSPRVEKRKTEIIRIARPARASVKVPSLAEKPSLGIRSSSYKLVPKKRFTYYAFNYKYFNTSCSQRTSIDIQPFYHFQIATESIPTALGYFPIIYIA